MRGIPAEITDLRCQCGARRDESNKRCRKCSVRGRWQRRKAWRSQKNLSATASERSDAT